MNLDPRHGAPELHRLNYSQDDVRLMTQLLPVRHAHNIAFSLDFQNGFDPELMRQAVRHLYERNDCLRLQFIHKGLSVRQLFREHAEPAPIPGIRFADSAEEEAFLRRFLQSSLDLFRGETLQLVFATLPSGMQRIFCKTSHFAADLYGISILVADLTAVYDALRDGKELPPPPGSFEALVRKDNAQSADGKRREAHRAFFRDYFAKAGRGRPQYCGIHGPDSKRWQRLKRRGLFYLPYDFLHPETRSFVCPVPDAAFRSIRTFCSDSGFSLSLFLYYACALATSLLHGRIPCQTALGFVDCRATVAERKAAGTKVQSLITCLDVDYGKSFRENLQRLREDLDDLYRHYQYDFWQAETQLQRLWHFPTFGYVHSFCFSFISRPYPDGVRMNLYNNGKSPMPTYVIALHDTADDSLSLRISAQEKVVPERPDAFFDCFVRIVGQAVARPDTPLDQIL